MAKEARGTPRRREQQGDLHALDRGNDPRGGVQSADYRTADPRELVQDGDTVMSAPGGAAQEGSSPEERRAQDRS